MPGRRNSFRTLKWRHGAPFAIAIAVILGVVLFYMHERHAVVECSRVLMKSTQFTIEGKYISFADTDGDGIGNPSRESVIVTAANDADKIVTIIANATPAPFRDMSIPLLSRFAIHDQEALAIYAASDDPLIKYRISIKTSGYMIIRRDVINDGITSHEHSNWYKVDMGSLLSINTISRVL